jgi:hypothetical protein
VSKRGTFVHGIHEEALLVCMEKKIPLTEELVDRLCPVESNTQLDPENVELLNNVADICMKQKLYYLASKKYAQVIRFFGYLRD